MLEGTGVASNARDRVSQLFSFDPAILGEACTGPQSTSAFGRWPSHGTREARWRVGFILSSSGQVRSAQKRSQASVFASLASSTRSPSLTAMDTPYAPLSPAVRSSKRSRRPLFVVCGLLLIIVLVSGAHPTPREKVKQAWSERVRPYTQSATKEDTPPKFKKIVVFGDSLSDDG